MIILLKHGLYISAIQVIVPNLFLIDPVHHSDYCVYGSRGRISGPVPPEDTDHFYGCVGPNDLGRYCRT